MRKLLTSLIAALSVLVAGVSSTSNAEAGYSGKTDIPAYSSSASVELNGNIPSFTEAELTASSYENYSSLDDLGRCGTATACIGTDLMPTEERGSIGMIKPTGWSQNKYPGIVDSNPPYLYNRCHLIGYQLSGENANEKNLITGTRYMNVDGMLPYENRVADYVKSSGNHVLYRVTPVFSGSNLLSDGVQIEAYSVEDSGRGISFNVFCYNVQPGVDIDYSDGSNKLSDKASEDKESAADSQTGSSKSTEKSELQQETGTGAAASYIANKNTKKFHYPDCSSVSDMKEKNKWYFTGSRDELISQGYDPCKRCNP